MNFKENYQREMDEIQKPSDITEKILNAVDMEQKTYATDIGQEKYASKKNRNILQNAAVWRTAVAAIAIACMLGFWQHEKVLGFAQSIVDRFTLSVNNKEDIEFGKLKPVNMDVEAFINNAETEPFSGGSEISYDHWFTSYQEMNQLTNLEFPCADKVEYRDIHVDIFPEYKNGHISAEILYQGVSYNIAGMFTIEGFDQKEWGYGDKGKKEVYQYGEGKKACFIKDSDGYDRVYFEEGDILFQVGFNNGIDDETGIASANKKQMKELLNLFGSEN